MRYRELFVALCGRAKHCLLAADFYYSRLPDARQYAAARVGHTCTERPADDPPNVQRARDETKPRRKDVMPKSRRS
jgi:hypothetical protein